MSFNKNASKRLGIIAGVSRESREITDMINNIAHNYLQTLLTRLVSITLFSGRKTIIIDDIRFISQICSDYPNIALPSNLSNLTKARITSLDIERVMSGQYGYNIYTLKKPFDNLVRDIIHNLHSEEIRIGKNVVSLLQTMTEQYVIIVINHAATYTARDNRETLLPRDIETTLQTIFKKTRYNIHEHKEKTTVL